MNKKNIIIIVLLVIVTLVFMAMCILKTINFNYNYNEESGELEYTNEKVSSILNSNIEYDLSDEEEYYSIDAYIKSNNSDVTVEGNKNVDIVDNTILIKEAGNYSFSGNFENFAVKISVSKEDTVKILLDGVVISSKDGPAIYMESGDKCIITAKSGTENEIRDVADYKDTSDESLKAAVYSKGDLVINGAGKLTIKGKYNDALSTSDKFRVFNTELIIEAIDDGIRGKDYVYIKNATINLKTSGDGIKSTNEESDEKGFVVIENSNLTINCENDAITAKSSLYISGGNYNIKTGDGSNVTNTKNEGVGFFNDPSKTKSTENTVSKKGLKAETNITIDSGSFTFDTEDDAIHSNNVVKINGGKFSIKSGDDGIHSDTELYIKDADINIEKSYEGLESFKITIDSGTINVVASDDGINVAGGNDMSSMSGRVGQNSFNMNGNTKSDAVLNINGGNIVVNSDGDGLDSNGSIYITGGDIVVHGPTNDGNGALDYDSECKITGGSLIAIGSSGMLQASSSSSTQTGFGYALDSYYNAGSKIVIKDSNSNQIASLVAEKKFSSVVYSSDKLKEGETYYIEIDGTSAGSITLNDLVTLNKNAGQMMGPGGRDNRMQRPY